MRPSPDAYNTTGSNNIALGAYAGHNEAFQSFVHGSNNIYIGAQAQVMDEHDVIRIGTKRPALQTFIAGIYGGSTLPLGGVAVYIDSSGALGTNTSSRQYKDGIADMGDTSAVLMRLRPVTFTYKSHGEPAKRTLQYGLVAEEVADVNPGLVARGADGQVDTVFYQFLPPMLLNEYQRQQRTIAKQEAALAEQAVRIARLEKQAAELVTLKNQMVRMVQALDPLDRDDLESGRFANGIAH